MANTFKFGNGSWAVKDGLALAYNDESNNFKPLPFDFTRASSATRVNKQGLIETVRPNRPRIDFTDNTSGHLLLEPSRTNKYPYSNQKVSAGLETFGTGTNSITVTNNYATSPDGSQNAMRMVATCGSTTSDRAGLRDLLSMSASSATLSFYAKSNTSSSQTISVHFNGTNKQTITLTTEWQRFTYTDTSATSNNSGVEIRGTITDTNVDVLLFGFQMEQAIYATSYIPTEGSSVTRSDDYAIDAGNSDVFSNTELSWFLDIEGFAEDGTNRYISISDNGGSPYTNGYNVQYRSDGNIRVFRNGLDFANAISIANIDQAVRQKIAIRFKQDDMKVYINGVSQNINASYVFQSMSGIDSMRFTQQNSTTSNAFDGKIYEMRVWNEALTDTQLQNLTS